MGKGKGEPRGNLLFYTEVNQEIGIKKPMTQISFLTEMRQNEG